MKAIYPLLILLFCPTSLLLAQICPGALQKLSLYGYPEIEKAMTLDQFQSILGEGDLIPSREVSSTVDGTTTLKSAFFSPIGSHNSLNFCPVVIHFSNKILLDTESFITPSMVHGKITHETSFLTAPDQAEEYVVEYFPLLTSEVVYLGQKDVSLFQACQIVVPESMYDTVVDRIKWVGLKTSSGDPLESLVQIRKEVDFTKVVDSYFLKGPTDDSLVVAHYKLFTVDHRSLGAVLIVSSHTFWLLI